MINSVVLVGRLGTDPELRYTPNGTAVCNLNVAVSDIRSNGEERTHWFRIVCFGKLAETCNEFLEKGRQIAIQGSLAQSSWENEDGERRSRVEVIANRIQFLGSKKETQEAEEPPF